MVKNRALWAAAAAMGLAFGGTGLARAGDVFWSVGVNSPGIALGVANSFPMYVQPAPVYVQPAPTYYNAVPAPVYRAPPRPVYYAPPVAFVPPPAVHYREYRDHRGRGHHHHHGHRGNWDEGHGRGRWGER